MSNLYYAYRGDAPRPPRQHTPSADGSPPLPFPNAHAWTDQPPLAPFPSARPFEDPLFPVMPKPFPDSVRPPASHSLSDHFPRPQSAVFDPSEFPSLGAGISAPLPPSSSLLPAPPLDAPLLSSPTAASISSLSHYPDIYPISAYPDGRAKAVDALTGPSVAAEFNMQSEDFPALGGTPVVSTLRPTNASHLSTSVATAPAAPSLPALDPLSSDPFFDRSAAFTLSQPPAPPQHLPNGYQVDPASAPISERATQLLPMQHRPNQQLASSPPPLSQAPLHSVIVGHREKSGSDRPVSEQFDLLGRRDSRAQHPLSTRVPAVPNGDDFAGCAQPLNGPVSTSQEATPLLTRLAGTSLEQSHNAPSASAAKYGMKALLPIVLPLSDSTGKNENILSVGLDLTALGLNLNSSEPLHKTFENPWEGGQGSVTVSDNFGSSPKSQKEPEYKLPTCYYMQPPAIRSSHFTKFQLETLFYIFYTMARDMLQLLAAVELYNRKWRYHKGLKLWFKCDTEPNGGYENAAYIYFDIKSWERREFHEANPSFIQGLMTEEELNAVKIPSL